MLKNYFKIAYRNLIRRRGYAFLNIFGLAMGMMCSVLILLWIQSERDIDGFHEHSDRLYAVWRNETNQGKITTWDYTPYPYGPVLKASYPEVEAFSRMTEWGDFLISSEETHIYEPVSFVDPDFFKLFTFPAMIGDPISALEDPNSIVISETLAKKHFGEKNPIGKTLRMENQIDFEIRAVLKDLPVNTKIPFTAFIPIKKAEEMGWMSDFWGNNSMRTFVLLNEGTDLKSFNEKYKIFTATHSESTSIDDFLYPVKDLHLKSKFENGIPVGGRIDLIKTFGLVAIAILLIACINFMNLSTAQSQKRSKEVGVRKIVGADRKMLIGQFLAESTIISFLAYGLAIMGINLVFPYYNNLLSQNIMLPFNLPEFWIFSGAYIMLTGILAGSYPAFYLSSFKPTSIFKSGLEQVRYWFKPREVLVVFQFTVVTVLIASTWIIRQQMIFVQNRDIGFNTENLIYHPLSTVLRGNYQSYRNELLEMEEVAEVTATFSPITNIHSDTNGMKWQGKDETFKPNIGRMTSDVSFTETMGIELIAGRDIDIYSYPSDSSAVIINQAVSDMLGFEDPLGQIITDDDRNYTIVGVAKDFLMSSPFENARPIMVSGPRGGQSFVHIRFNEGYSLEKTLAKLEEKLKKFNPGYPFEYNFVDEVQEKKFTEQQQTAKLTTIFSGLSILISCLGLFGLAAFLAEQRSKEISVRKVLGASIRELVAMISWEFTRLVLLAVFIGIPICWYFMGNWLDTFDYRTSIQWQVFLWTGILSLLIAFLTVSSQAIKAALVNPAEILKSE